MKKTIKKLALILLTAALMLTVTGCGANDYQTAVQAEEFNMNLSTCALNGGEDYELLFTVPIADHEKVAEMEGVKLIGHITKPELGCALITRDGQEFELKAQGWNPLKEEEAEKA